mmetsp:Transcript_10918/g.24106  ORF Transcript_10918/g.24106 Transcript_10918/m.24106 type:complete len:152 (-) Transcript_10918:960-1415(-)
MLSGMDRTTNDLLDRLVYYFLDLALLDYKLFVSTSPSLLTASAVYLARATLGLREPNRGKTPTSRKDSTKEAKLFWSNTMEYYTSYKRKDLEGTVKILHILHEGADCCKFVALYERHGCCGQHGSIAERMVLHESDLGLENTKLEEEAHDD